MASKLMKNANSKCTINNFKDSCAEWGHKYGHCKQSDGKEQSDG